MAQLRLAASLALFCSTIALADGGPPVSRRITANALPPFTAISAKGFVHSTEYGFKFPDGSVQTTAATVTGGVPNVNGIAGAVTIEGDDWTSVSTSGSTITISSPIVYSRTRIVSPVLNNTLASGSALLGALADITDASSSKRYLLKIEPGIYDIGANQLVMKSFVDIEGSAAGNTIILAARGNNVDLSAAGSALIAATSSELRDIGILNDASEAATALWVENVRGFRVRNATIRVRSTTISAIGIMVINSDLDASLVTINAGEGTAAAPRGIAILPGNADVNLFGCNISAVTSTSPSGTASAVLVNSTTATVTIDSSTLVARRGTTAIGLDLVAGTVSMRNSELRVEDTANRRAVFTGSTADAILSVHHSLLIAGDVWNDSNVRAVYRQGSASVRVYASLVDSASTGSPLCLQSYYVAGNLTTTCAK